MKRELFQFNRKLFVFMFGLYKQRQYDARSAIFSYMVFKVSVINFCHEICLFIYSFQKKKL